MPPTMRNSNVTVASAPASARLTSKLRRMSVSTNVMMVKSKASSVHAANVVRKVFHSWRETSLYQGIAGILSAFAGIGGTVTSSHTETREAGEGEQTFRRVIP